MKPLSLIASCAITCIVSLLLQACNKHHDDSPGIPCCQIIQIRQGIFDEDSLAFVYNTKGNPVSITRANVITGSPNFLFLYDKKGRMTDFYGVYTSPNPSFDVWHRYKYDGQNRIVVDSTYEFGIVGPGMPLPDDVHNGKLRVRNISTYQYDWKDRIIQSTDTDGSESGIRTRVYTYNHEGNLAKLFTKYGMDTSTRFFSFDNKVNFRRLHPIWQFLDRDYSMNNSVIASDFNTYGLPRIIDFTGHFYGQFATIPLNNVVIKYSCK